MYHLSVGIFVNGYPFAHIPTNKSVGISENGYPVSDNRTLNCEGVAPSHIKGGETAMGHPFWT